VAFCDECGYAANVEKASSGVARGEGKGEGEVEKFATPGVLTIEALAKAPHNVAPERQIKTLVYIAQSKPVLI